MPFRGSDFPAGWELWEQTGRFVFTAECAPFFLLCFAICHLEWRGLDKQFPELLKGKLPLPERDRLEFSHPRDEDKETGLRPSSPSRVTTETLKVNSLFLKNGHQIK